MGSHIQTISSGAASLTPSTHPNKMMFRGVLVRLDEPSNKPPNGAQGHRILVRSDVAKRRLNTLIGMGLNYSPDLKVHAQRRKVGVIEKAWIDDKDLWVEGVVWKHDFPEAQQDLKKQGLGMSMELGDVDVADANADVWDLKDFVFLGGTILWKKSAAYFRTQAIAAKADERSSHMTGKKKTAKPEQPELNSKVVELVASAAAKSVTDSLTPTLQTLAKAVTAQSARLDAMELNFIASGNGKVATITAEDDEEDVNAGSDEDDDVTAGKKKEEEDDDEEEEDDEDIDSATDKGDLKDMGPAFPEGEADDDEPGHLTDSAKNKGSKTTSEDNVGKTVSSSLYQEAMKANKKLAAQVANLTAQVANLTKSFKKQKKALEAASANTPRRSVPVLTNQLAQGLLAKGGINASELVETGQKLTIAEVDSLLVAISPNLSPTDRIAAKNNLIQAGLMEDGVRR